MFRVSGSLVLGNFETGLVYGKTGPSYDTQRDQTAALKVKHTVPVSSEEIRAMEPSRDVMGNPARTILVLGSALGFFRPWKLGGNKWQVVIAALFAPNDQENHGKPPDHLLMGIDAMDSVRGCSKELVYSGRRRGSMA